MQVITNCEKRHLFEYIKTPHIGMSLVSRLYLFLTLRLRHHRFRTWVFYWHLRYYIVDKVDENSSALSKSTLTVQRTRASKTETEYYKQLTHNRVQNAAPVNKNSAKIKTFLISFGVRNPHCLLGSLSIRFKKDKFSPQHNKLSTTKLTTCRLTINL
jgi:hypothetical protein